MSDQEIRALVRVAMDVRGVSSALNRERRETLRARVMRQLDAALRPTLRERVGAAGALLGRPFPALSRVATIALVFVSLVAGASAASADSLPDDPLYGLKLSSEQLRLSLAHDATDRAAVELGIAENRLREASALAAQDRDTEADAAASAFGEHLANAVASLEESTAAPSDLVEQLRTRVARQREQLKPATPDAEPNAVTVLASATLEIATPGADGGTIADAAARAAEQAATLAHSPTQRMLSPEQRAKVQAAAKAAKDAAGRARAAAERAKKAAAQRAKREKAMIDRSDLADREDDGR